MSLPTIAASANLLVPPRPRTYNFRGVLLGGNLFVVRTVRNNVWNIGVMNELLPSDVNTAWPTVCGTRTSAVTNRRL